jgi:hypothetical protein
MTEIPKPVLYLPTDFRKFNGRTKLMVFLAREIGSDDEWEEMRAEHKHLDCLRKFYEIKNVRTDNEKR